MMSTSSSISWCGLFLIGSLSYEVCSRKLYRAEICLVLGSSGLELVGAVVSFRLAVREGAMSEILLLQNKGTCC